MVWYDENFDEWRWIEPFEEALESWLTQPND